MVDRNKQWLSRREAAAELGLSEIRFKYLVSKKYKGNKPLCRRGETTARMWRRDQLHAWFESEFPTNNPNLENNSAKEENKAKKAKKYKQV